MRKKITKKPLAIVLAMLLVCIVSVAGTIAYLQATTGPVTNTFVVGSLFETDGGIELKEHEAIYENNGIYTLQGDVEVLENRYDNILPGVDVQKDPFVRITGLKENAYLFIEVVDKLSPGLTAKVNSEYWRSTNLLGKHGGKVYVYNANEGIFIVNDSPVNVRGILEDNKVIVANEYAGSQEEETLQFYGYIIQAGGFDDYTAAWAALAL